MRDTWLFRQTKPNKPNLSQNKPNSNPIFRKAKIDAKCVFTKDYEEKDEYGPKKTNPIQTQFKPIKANFNAKQSQFKPNFNGLDNNLPNCYIELSELKAEKC